MDELLTAVKGSLFPLEMQVRQMYGAVSSLQDVRRILKTLLDMRHVMIEYKGPAYIDKCDADFLKQYKVTEDKINSLIDIANYRLAHEKQSNENQLPRNGKKTNQVFLSEDYIEKDKLPDLKLILPSIARWCRGKSGIYITSIVIVLIEKDYLKEDINNNLSAFYRALVEAISRMHKKSEQNSIINVIRGILNNDAHKASPQLQKALDASRLSITHFEETVLKKM